MNYEQTNFASDGRGVTVPAFSLLFFFGFLPYANLKMKVFMHYDTPSDAHLHKTLKMTLPKKWVPGPSSKLLIQFVESYNTAFPLNTITVEGHHLELDNGISLSLNDIVEHTIKDRGDLFIRPGQSQEAESEFSLEQKLKNSAPPPPSSSSSSSSSSSAATAAATAANPQGQLITCKVIERSEGTSILAMNPVK